MRQIRNSLLLLRRELSQPELRLVFLAVVITVCAIASVGLFADRMSRLLAKQSNALLGADLVVYSFREIPLQWRQQAEQTGLQTSMNREFFSVLVLGEITRLVEVKAVDPNYPLRGKLGIDHLQGSQSGAIPASGTIWAEPRLLYQLQLEKGDTITLGNRDLQITGVIRHEPDRGGSLFNLAPRVIMNLEDLEATGLIGSGSRVRYRLLLAGEPEAIAKFREWIKPQLGANYQLQTVRESRPEVETSLERAERFLGLTLIVTIILSCVTIWVAMQSWVQRRIMYASVLKTLGLTRRHILHLFTIQVLIVAVSGCLVAILLALGVQSLLLDIMKDFVSGTMPAINPWVALAACLIGLLLVLAFCMPAYFYFSSAAPNLVLRSMPEKLDQSHWSMLWGVLTLLVVMGWLVQDIRLLAVTLGGLTAALLLLLVLSALLLHALRRLKLPFPVAVRLGINALFRHRRESMTMMSVFGLTFLFVALLVMVRTDLIDQWRDRLPEDTPNTFIVNVPRSDEAAVSNWMKSHGLKNVDFYPMIKGRLVGHNGKKVTADNYESSRAKQLVQREFNLSWSDEKPEHNKIIEGEWLDDTSKPQWSIEADIASRLGIKMGDTLIYDVNGTLVSGEITSIREVEWDSFKVNFFVLGQGAMLAHHPGKYISSFYLPPEKEPLMSDLVRQFPYITVLDVDAIMKHVRQVIDRVSAVAEVAFFFTLAAAVLLVIGMILAGRRLRQHETALLRAMGSEKRTLMIAQITEFMIVGACAGLLAMVISNIMTWIIATRLLEFNYQINFSLALGVIASGIVIALLTGWLILRGQHRQSPMLLLRKG